MTKYFQNILISLVLVSCNGKYTTAETYSEEPLGGSANVSTGGVVENSGGSIVENTGGVIENTGGSFPDNTGGNIDEIECTSISCDQPTSGSITACFYIHAADNGAFSISGGECVITLNGRILSPEDFEGALESGTLEISGCSYWFYRECS